MQYNGAAVRYEKEYIRKNGSRVPIELLVQLKTDADGQPEFYYAFVTDITERKRAERLIRKNEERMLLATEATGVGIWEWNIITNKIRWDAQMFRIYGVTPTPDSFVDYHVWSDAVLPEELRRQEEQMQEAIRQLGHCSREFRIHRADDGKCRYIQAVEIVRSNTHGQAEWLVGTNLDITERKQTELALLEAAERKDEFLAMLAHELRNPLAPILNAIHILQQAGADPKRIAWCCNIIDRQLKHLIRLVDDLLDISRIKRGLIELKSERLEIRDFIQPAVEANQPLLDASRHDFSLTLPTEALWVAGDRIRLAQIVSNLINNAAKYTGEGGQIKLSAVAEGDWISILVADNGCGIEPDDLDKLFDLFYQANRNLDRSQGGLGIGLSLVQSLVRQHGGEVRVFSAGRGQGSQFQVRLPRIQLPAASALEACATQVVNPQKLRILAVDDNPDVAESLCLLLELDGHQVQIAHDAQSAQAMAFTVQPDVILLDIGLPEMDGYKVAKELRRCPELQHTLMIALTGYGRPEDKVKSLAAGFDEHMVKPADIDVLRRLLSDYSARRNLNAFKSRLS